MRIFSRRTALLSGTMAWLATPIVGCAASIAAPQPIDLVPADLREALKPFDPALWPGPVGSAEQAAYKAAAKGLFEAMLARDMARIKNAVVTTRSALGKWDSVPEVLFPYGAPINAAAPNDVVATRLTVDSYRNFLSRAPWHDPARGSDHPTARLRITARAAEAMLRLNLAGLDPGGLLLKEAVLALEYAMSVQAPNGAFGYPYVAEGGSVVAQDAAQFVKKAQAEGREVLYKGWIIDDSNNGGLEFDNAVIGTTLLLAAHMTGRTDFVVSAVRCGDWALKRHFVPNINYNTLSAFLFARLYRVTGEAKWLEASKAIFRYVALPTQAASGRWFDPHNARIQYHSIIMRHALELYLALDKAGDPMKDQITVAVRRGLDNLASQILLYGSSDTDEMLTTEALMLGEAILGSSKLWHAAESIDVNEMVYHVAAKLQAHNMPVAPPMALYLQARQRRLEKTGPGAFETSTGF